MYSKNFTVYIVILIFDVYILNSRKTFQQFRLNVNLSNDGKYEKNTIGHPTARSSMG